MSTKLRVWSRFTVVTKDGDLKLRIQDAPKERLSDVVLMFLNHFVPEETFNKIAGIAKNEEARMEYIKFLPELIKNKKITICCEDDGTDKVGEIIGVSVMKLKEKGMANEVWAYKAKTKELNKLLELLNPVFAMYDAMKELNLDNLYDDIGISVHPDYRCLGIGQKLFKTRRQICKDEGVVMTSALVTGYGSQKAAEKDGWETVFEITYEELEKMLNVTFKDVPATCKVVVGRP